MYTPREQKVLDDIIEVEGGWVNNPVDHGGPTNLGITLRTLQNHRPAASVDDLIHLTVDEAQAIYYVDYVKPFTIIEHDEIFGFVCQSAVQHGPARAVRLLQTACNALHATTPLAVDGNFGPETRRVVSRCVTFSAFRLYCELIRARARYYADILEADKTQLRFAAGWFNRLAEDI